MVSLCLVLRSLLGNDVITTAALRRLVSSDLKNSRGNSITMGVAIGTRDAEDRAKGSSTLT
jgi:hypothetical protein